MLRVSTVVVQGGLVDGRWIPSCVRTALQMVASLHAHAIKRTFAHDRDRSFDGFRWKLEAHMLQQEAKYTVPHPPWM